MKSRNIRKMYFARQRKLLEVEGKQTIEKRESKMQKFMLFAMVTAFILLINAVVVPTH